MIEFNPCAGISGGFGGRDLTGPKERGLSPADFFQLKQVHSDRVILLKNESDLALFKNTEADAVITTLKGVPLAVRTADCVPILIAHPSGAIAAVHSGWKGTSLKILLKTLQQMQNDLKLDLSRAFVAIGPAICGHCYEVGEEVAEQFFKGWKADVLHSASRGKFLLDLKFANQLLAIEAGVPFSQITVRPECTLCHEKEFYSYRGALRRGEKGEGRNYAWILNDD